jgi:hypothetical protein
MKKIYIIYYFIIICRTGTDECPLPIISLNLYIGIRDVG